MGVEIERKFLVDRYKWSALQKPQSTHLKQGYMLKDDDKTIRIRIAGKQGFITIKGRSKGISRTEHEYEIPLTEAAELLDNFCGAVVEKNRYEILVAGKLWEMDEFLADNAGLLVAEIELDTEDEVFDLPDWVTQEVTDDARYFNSSLSVHPYSKW